VNRGITPLILSNDTGLEDSEGREMFRSYPEVILAPEDYLIIHMNQLRGHNKQLCGAHF